MPSVFRRRAVADDAPTPDEAASTNGAAATNGAATNGAASGGAGVPAGARRPSAPAGTRNDAAADEPGASQRRGHTEKKGRPTPKRTSQHRVVQPPPANKREAYRRMREKDRAERAEKMAGMRAGDERYLQRKDQGKDRALARDVVDSRRNLGFFLLPTAFLMLIVYTFTARLLYLQSLLFLVFLLVILVIAIDSAILARKLGRLMRERMPEITHRGGTYYYAISRAGLPRQWRIPKPRVQRGQPV